jgi:hypothetical protein
VVIVLMSFLLEQQCFTSQSKCHNKLCSMPTKHENVVGELQQQPLTCTTQGTEHCLAALLLVTLEQSVCNF